MSQFGLTSMWIGTGNLVLFFCLVQDRPWLLFRFVIAQSPDKMKGLTVGFMAVVQGAAFYILTFFLPLMFTFCFDLLVVSFVVLFAIFLLLSKWYTLRERNREINIQAIVEEHYERYMDQEEEYLRERHY